ncbi:MAG TPA: right-handed parallel beta-helix repeat-containing protein, partial [Pyrinomonadaceae bacterium]
MKQFILIFAFCALSLFLTSNVTATTLIVTKTIDSNDGVCDADCSLREAIAAAAVSGDTIAFSELFNSAQTITLGGTSLVINKNLTINGNGPQLLKISANQMSRVFDIPVGFTVALSGMTITRGRAVAFVNGINDGGGIYTKGNLTIDNCVVTDNIASMNGAGIYNEGTLLTVTNSTISLNFTPVYAGGGIDGNGVVNVSNSSIINNAGSGIKSFNTVTVSNSLISGNYYGGIRAGSLTVSNSTVSNNFGGIGSG